MGSRRGRYAALSRRFALAVVFAAGCSSAASTGTVSSARGDQWSFPILGPLENGVLLTPVTINTSGPYLFAVDTDAGVSVVDAAVVRDAKLETIGGPRRLDESNTSQSRVYAVMLNAEIGTLIVEQREVMVARLGTYDQLGRRVHGVIGRDILADGVAFGFDREQGLGFLVASKAFKPPDGASAIPYEPLPSRIKGDASPEQRRLVRVRLGETERALHVDLGAAASQLREPLWDDAKLVAHDVDATVVDEIGTARKVTRASAPVPVALGPLTGTTAFIPYDDKRWGDSELAGTLGLGFFAAYSLWIGWDAHTLYASPRKPVPAERRIARWDSPVLSKCPNPGCIQARLVDPLQGKPPEDGKLHPGVVLSITRDEPAGGMDLEVYLEAEGQPQLPYLILNLPAHVDRMIHQLKPEFLGAKLVVVDASPFPRRCPSRNGCVDQLAR